MDLDPPLPLKLPMTNLPSARHAGERPHLLVVEDEAIIAMDIADQLEEMGYRVCGTVNNGRDALTQAEKLRPDLVLMDIVIKGEMDGIETARHIAHRFRIPVIFLTSYSDTATVERATQTAPYGYLTKPFQAKDLRGAIEVALYKARLELRLRESERWFSSALRCLADGVIATDLAGHVQFMSPAAELVCGRQLVDVLGKPIDAVLTMTDGASVSTSLADDRAGIAFGRRLKSASGATLPIDVARAPFRGDDGSVVGSVFTIRDARERLAAEAKLAASDSPFRTAFELASVGLALVTLDGRFLQGNAALLQWLGCSPGKLARLSLADVSHPEDVEPERALRHQLLSGELHAVQHEKRYRTPSGGDRATLTNISLLTERNVPLCYLYQIHDRTDRARDEPVPSEVASRDPLTGLVNRAQLFTELEREVEHARRQRGHVAVVFIGFDGVTRIDTSLGPQAADQLLQVLAMRVRTALRETDCVARLGARAFVAVLPNVSSMHHATVATERLRTALAQPVPLQGQDTQVVPSVGVSLYPDHGTDVTTLLHSAERALHIAQRRPV